MHSRYSAAAASFAAFLFLLTPIFAAAAAEPPSGGESRFNGEIIIGATFPLSGEMAYYGQSAYYGANTRVNLVNAAGGVNGKRLVIKWLDNRSDPELAVKSVKELVDKHDVQAILGPLLSDSAIAMQKTANEEKIVCISPLAASDAVTRGQEWMFRSCFSNTVQAEGMTQFQMNSFGARTCAILYDPRHKFSDELAGVFERTFRAAGGKIVGTLSIINYYGEKDYAGPLKKLSAYSPDFIFAPCYAAEAVELVHAARDLKIGIPFAGPMTWDNELLFLASGRRLAGSSLTSALFEKSYSYAPFQTFYKAMEDAGMDEPDAMAASAYDAVTLLVEGLKNGESAVKIREGILSVKDLPLATGVATVDPDHTVRKPVIIRYVEQQRGRLIPVFAERYDP